MRNNENNTEIKVFVRKFLKNVHTKIVFTY